MKFIRPEVLSFLDAIKNEPEDDTLRLILADWLADEGDEERGQFIRTQCRRARVEENSAEWLELKQREEPWLERHQRQWVGPLAALEGRVTWHRGLIQLECQALRLLELAEEAQEWTEAWAWVERLWLRGIRTPDFQALLQLPLLRQITGLDLSINQIGDLRARALAGCPYLERLTELNLAGNYITVSGAYALAASPHLPRLTHLNLTGNTIGDVGLRALADSPHRSGLRHLNLERNSIGDAGAQILAGSRHLCSLTHLRLVQNWIGDTGARALAQASHLERLAELDLGHNRISNAGKSALVKRYGSSLRL